jgi:hypothetical protein
VAVSPTPEQEDQDSDIEIIPPFKIAKSVTHNSEKMRQEVTHKLKSTRAKTCPVAPTSRQSDARSTSMPTGRTPHAMSKSRPPSPSAERISQALKTQHRPTNKEMSRSFCMSKVSSAKYKSK